MQKITKIITNYIDFLYQPFAKYLPHQIFKYACCGGGNMFFEWILYFLLYNFIIGHNLIYINLFNNQLCITPHILTFCIVFPITFFTGFLLNKYVTFTTSKLKGWSQLIRYILVVLVNIMINYIGLKLFVDYLGWYPTPSKMMLTILTVIISFLGQKYFSFK